MQPCVVLMHGPSFGSSAAERNGVAPADGGEYDLVHIPPLNPFALPETTVLKGTITKAVARFEEI